MLSLHSEFFFFFLIVLAMISHKVIDDIRRSALAQLKETRLARWKGATPTYAKDGLFACRALLDSSKFVLAHGSKGPRGRSNRSCYPCAAPPAKRN